MLFFILIFVIYELRGNKIWEPTGQKTDGVIIYSDQIDNIKKNHCEGRYLRSKDFIHPMNFIAAFGLSWIDYSQQKYRLKGKFPIIISCRFKDKMVDGQKEGEWIDKTFLGKM